MFFFVFRERSILWRSLLMDVTLLLQVRFFVFIRFFFSVDELICHKHSHDLSKQSYDNVLNEPLAGNNCSLCFFLFAWVSYFLGAVIFAQSRSLLVSNTYQRLIVYKSLFQFSGVDKRILVWDLAEGTLLTELKGHSDTVYSLSFSRDGNILASGLLRQYIRSFFQ